MVRNEYGKTTWGKAFLDALGRMDTNARLGRGKTYANTGRVLSINLAGSKITSRVQGREDVYSVSVSFQEFTARNKQSVYAIIEQNPLILAHILNGELPDSLLDVLEKARIFLLPSQWHEIKGRCSCPDWGNPCKHMAAVYFLLTSEIDKNPFTLFMLRGVDLMQYFNIKKSEMEPSYPLPVTIASQDGACSGTDVVDCGSSPKLSECELLKLEPMGNFILDCLSPNPPFSAQLDYKDAMIEFYRHGIKKTGLVVTAQKEMDLWFKDVEMDSFQRLWSQSHFHIRLSEKFTEGKVYIHNEMFDDNVEPASVLGNIPFSIVPFKEKTKGKEEVFEEKWLKLDLFVALQVFLKLTNDFGTPSYRYLFYVARVSLVLMNSQSYIPDVLPMNYHQDTGKLASFKIIWKPLFSSSVIEQQLSNLAALYPLHGKMMETHRPIVLLDKKPLDAKSAGLHLLSSLLTSLVVKLGFMHKKCKNNPPKESLAFFCGQTYHVISLAEQNVPKAIVKYFGVFELMKTDFDVAVHVDKPSTLSTVNVKSQKECTNTGNGSDSTVSGDQYSMGLWFKRKKTDSSHSLTIRSYLQTFPDDRNKVLRFLSSLSPYLNNVEQLLFRDSFALAADDLELFILQTSRMLKNLGVKVVLAKELRKVLKPRAVVRTRSKSRLDEEKQSKQSFLKLGQLLSYDWMISIGDELVSVEQFEAMVKSGKKLIKFKDKYIEISADEMRNILAAVRKRPVLASPMELLRETLLENRVYHLEDDVREFLNGFLRVSNSQVPTDLLATLREYQVKGYQWLTSNLVNGFGCILADDMGLGKTVQTIATILHLKKQGLLPHPALVVVPTTLLVNWTRELKKFAPNLTVSSYYGADRCLTGVEQESQGVSGNKNGEMSPSTANGYTLNKIKSAGRSSDTEIDWKSKLPKIKKEEQMDCDTKPDENTLKSYNAVGNSVSNSSILGKRVSSAGVNGRDIKRLKLEKSISSDVKPCVHSIEVKYKSEINEDQPSQSKKVKAAPRRMKSKENSHRNDDVILTTYQIIWRDLEIFQKKQFSLLCIDEAQKIKNCKSQTSKGLKKIKAPMKIALSGTPVENNLSELWSVFDFVIPGYMGTLKEFSDKYAKDIEVRCDQETLKALKKVISPFVMRRLKTDRNIIRDLPDKIVDNKYAMLSSEQAALYEGVVQDITRQIDAASGINRRGVIFKLLTALKQICNHPANYNESASPSLESSGKMKLLVQLLEPILKEGEKVLIFTQYVRMVKLLTVMIQKHFHVNPLQLEGSMNQRKRDQAVTLFQTCPHHQIFIVSLKAGGVGLNLTAANHVIHYDLWYNPAVENQATDRAFRIGQVKNVFVYRLITLNTFEERIDEMLKKKQELSNMSITVKEDWITEMSNEQLKELFMMRS